MKRVYRISSGSEFKRAPHQSQRCLLGSDAYLARLIHTLQTAGFRLDSQATYCRHCGTPGGTMTGHVDRSQDKETCRKLISLGYSRSNRVRPMARNFSWFQILFPM